MNLIVNNESKIQYQKLLNSIVDGIIILSYPSGEIKDINESALRYIGYQKNQLIGKIFWELNLINDQSCALEIYANLLRQGVHSQKNIEMNSFDDHKIFLDFKSEVFKLNHNSIIQINLHSNQELDALSNELNEVRDLSSTAINDVIDALVTMTKFKDSYTSKHQINVSKLAVALAQEINLTQSQIDSIRASSLVHDIGKIAIPAEILTKSSALNAYEMALIKSHVVIGYDILKGIKFPWQLAKIVLQHHEKNDGTGYPNNLHESEICIESKILAVADTVEAMAHFRPYRQALGIEAALHQIDIDKETKFDLNITDACINLFNSKKFTFDN